MRKAILLTWCFLLCWAKPVCAQPQCTVTHYDEINGMAQWYVKRVVQDQQGMIWFATWNGLNRYDGYEFECFKSRVGDDVDVPSDRIRDIVLTKDGDLRCLVDEAVFGFSTKTYRFYKLSEAEENQLQAELKRSHKAEVAFESNGKPDHFKDIYGTEWTVTQVGNLKYKNPKTGQYVDYPADWKGIDRIRYCITDKEGNAWLTSNYGVFKLSFKEKTESTTYDIQGNRVNTSYKGIVVKGGKKIIQR